LIKNMGNFDNIKEGGVEPIIENRVGHAKFSDFTITISTAAFQSNSLLDIIELAKDNSISAIELSGNLEYLSEKKIFTLLSNNISEIEFFFHNYAPVPKKSSVLNLAHPSTVEQSIHHCRKVIDICKMFGINIFSVHAGMAFNPDPQCLGNLQSQYQTINFNDSQRLLLSAVHKIADYALQNDVFILIENNVVPLFNCPDRANKRYHFADLSDCRNMLTILSHPNIGLLLDVGHLKVCAQTFGFKAEDFISVYSDKIKAVHLSENDGTSDQNLPVKTDSWFWNQISWDGLRYISLEIKPQPANILKTQVDLIGSKIY
jgi:sugar phosphate isomerase/epimerase